MLILGGSRDPTGRLATVGVMALVMASHACTGHVDSGWSDGGEACDGGCPDGSSCEGGICVPASDLCGSVRCPFDTHCEDGICVPDDLCEGIECTNPGEVCQDGECISGEMDQDGDGFRARDECNDGDPTVHPGATEVCNGIDDDCDADVDEETGGAACSTELPGVCAMGTERCDAGRLRCVATSAPGPETCDGADEDCDGEVDEGTSGDACDTGMPGVCAAGRERCNHGSLSCVALETPRPETCDGADEDCDGEVDECPSPTGLCFGGSCVNPPSGCSGLETYSGHLYAVCDSSVTWFEARATCVAWGGYLVVLNSSGEDAFVRTIASGWRWLGYTDQASEGVWSWVDARGSYTRWCAGEPSATCCYGEYPGCPGGAGGGDQDCAVTGYGCTTGTVGMDDQHCCWTNAFMCERS